MIALILCKDCPYIKTCIANLNDRTITGCGMALFINGLIKYDEIGIEHTVNTKEGDKEWTQNTIF